MTDVFRRVAARVSTWAGTASVFLGAAIVVVIWGFSGPTFHFSNTWQLVINTGTTIITFLMVFLIQNTQNRDSRAVQIKLDELIRAMKGARLQYLGLEDLSDDELTELDNEFKQIAARPGSARAITKLQAKIQAEHAGRHHIHAPAMVTNLLHRQPAQNQPIQSQPIQSQPTTNDPPQPPRTL